MSKFAKVIPVVAGVDEESMSTNQEATPVPYLAGTRKIATRWLTRAWDAKARPAPKESSGGKGSGKASGKGGGSASESYNYFASLAGLICSGPLTILRGAIVDQELKWSGDVTLSAEASPYPFTVSGLGDFVFYRGAYDQTTVDSSLPSEGTDLTHPAYTGFAYFIAKEILFGKERTTAPDIEWIVERVPVQNLITGPAALADDGQVNPFCIFAELLTSPWVGLGIPEEKFNKSKWQAAANSAYARKDLTYVSFFMNDQRELREVAGDMLAMCNGWWRVDRATGGCEVGVWTEPEAINVSNLPTITKRTLIEPPELDPETWGDVLSRYGVTYTDRDKDYKQRLVKHSDPRARRGADKTAPVTLSRTQIARRAQATAYVQDYTRRHALPGGAATATVRAETVDAVRPGDHVRLDVSTKTTVEKLQVCRVLSVSTDNRGAATLELEYEKSLVPIAHVTPENEDPQEVADIPDIEHATFIELPPALADGNEYAIGVLASRPSELVTECGFYYDQRNDDDSTFPLLGSHRGFALRGELTSSIEDDATTVTVDLLDTLNRELIASDPGPVAARNNELLMLIVHVQVGATTVMEICSCQSFVTSGANQVAVTVLRARCGTAAAAHDADTACFFISRESLPWYVHADFRSRAAGGEACYIKLQPGTYQASRPLEDCGLRTFTFDSSRAYAPVIDVTNPTEETVGCESGQAIPLAGTVSDLDGNLTSLTVIRVQGTNATETVVLDKSFAASPLMSFSIPAIGFDVEGSASIIIRAQDSTRRTIEKRITVIVGAVGGGGTIPTDKLLPPVLLDWRCYAAPAEVPLVLDYTPMPLDPPQPSVHWDNWAGRTLVWVKVKTPSIDGLTVDRATDVTPNYYGRPSLPAGECGLVAAGVPLVEHYIALSSVGAAAPETAWQCIQPDSSLEILDVDGNATGYETRLVRNAPGGINGANAGDIYTDIRCVYFPRAEGAVSIWIKAHDVHGIKTDSEIVRFDLYGSAP